MTIPLRKVPAGLFHAVCVGYWLVRAPRGRGGLERHLLGVVASSRIAAMRRLAAATLLGHARRSFDAVTVLVLLALREAQGEIGQFDNRQLLVCAEAACWHRDVDTFARVERLITSREMSVATRERLARLGAILAVGGGDAKVDDVAGAFTEVDAVRMHFPQLVHVLRASYLEQTGKRREAAEAYDRALATIHAHDPHRPTVVARAAYIKRFSRG